MLLPKNALWDSVIALTRIHSIKKRRSRVWQVTTMLLPWLIESEVSASSDSGLRGRSALELVRTSTSISQQHQGAGVKYDPCNSITQCPPGTICWFDGTAAMCEPILGDFQDLVILILFRLIAVYSLMLLVKKRTQTPLSG